ncbi:MAG: MerR family transcriptional regulator [Chloroflexota bacterium]
MSKLLIGEVAQRTGLSTSTIRYYENIGLLPQPHRINGRRRYDSDVIQQLKIIKSAQKASWSLAEIKKMVDGFPEHASLTERWRSMTPQKISELDSIIEEAQAAREMLEAGMNCQCRTMDECVIGQVW